MTTLTISLAEAHAQELLESLNDIVTFLHTHKSLPQGNLFHLNAASLLARIEEEVSMGKGR